MATNTRSNTSINNSEDSSEAPAASECIPWLFVLIIECLAIVILNIITIIVFVKQRQLQRRSTYLIIHLAIVDLLVGGVSGPVYIAGKNISCDKWRYHSVISVTLLFQFISVMNLAAISLERLHATFRPIQHRFLSNWHYGVIIFVMWFISVVLSSIPVVLHELFTRSLKLLTYYYYIYFSIDIFFILVICASYISILAKVRCSPRPRHDGGSNREQRLTTTLLMMTLASLLTWLPELVFFFIKSTPYFKDYIKISVHTKARLGFVLTTLAIANSLVNPILYAARMTEFRTVLSQLCKGTENQTESQDIQLDIRMP